MYVHVCRCICKCHSAWEHSEDNLGELVLSTPVCSGYLNQLVRLGGKHLYPMGHLIAPVCHFLWNRHSRHFFLALWNIQHVVTIIVTLRFLLSVLFMLRCSINYSPYSPTIVLPKLSLLLPTPSSSVTFYSQVLRPTFFPILPTSAPLTALASVCLVFFTYHDDKCPLLSSTLSQETRVSSISVSFSVVMLALYPTEHAGRISSCTNCAKDT